MDIKGWEGFYQISRDGRVKSLSRPIKREGEIGFRLTKDRILKPHISKQGMGYFHVYLIRDKKRYYISIHRLIAITFIENKDNKNWVNHIDGNKLNNAIENLEWVTPAENIIHAFKSGLKTCSGENNPNSFLSNKQVLEIRDMVEKGFKNREIAIKFNVGIYLIQRIKNRESWSHI